MFEMWRSDRIIVMRLSYMGMKNRGIKEEWKIKISENFKADKKIISEMIRC